jgi:hypothetical protein
MAVGLTAFLHCVFQIQSDVVEMIQSEEAPQASQAEAMVGEEERVRVRKLPKSSEGYVPWLTALSL